MSNDPVTSRDDAPSSRDEPKRRFPRAVAMWALCHRTIAAVRTSRLGRQMRRGWQRLLRAFWTEPGPSEQPDYRLPSDEHDQEIAAEYWKRSFQAPDSARARAQAGFAIVSVVGTVFVGGAAFARVQEQSLAVQVSALTASLFWVATIALYLNAATTASAPDPPSAEEDEPSTADHEAESWSEHLAGLTTIVQDERELVIWRTRRANYAGVAASAISVATLALLAFMPPAGERLGNVYLTPEGISAVRDAGCSPPAATGSFIRGRIDSGDLEKQYVTVVAEKSVTCPTGPQLSLRRDWVRLVSADR